MALFENGKIHTAVKTTPYVIPHSAGMAPSMVEALTKAQSKIITLKGQIGVSKAISGFIGMREMVATEKALKQAGVPIQETAHGKIIPATGTATALILQQQALTGAAKTTTEVGTEYREKVARVEILESKYQSMYEKMLGYRQELRDRPVIVEQKLGFDWGLPSFEDIKTPLLIGAVAIGGLFILGKFIGRKQ